MSLKQKKRKIIILGSSGSIGDSALKVVRALKNRFEVVGLSVDKNTALLKKQIRAFHPKAVAISDARAWQTFILDPQVKQWVQAGLKVYGGADGIKQLVRHPEADFIISGVVGAAGLGALLESLRQGKTVALANKEALVMAGELVLETARRHNATILPVDSEHSAMFQCIQGQNGNAIRKIILTASGGAFYRHKGDLSQVSVAKALAHPNWVMGKKITIDSATLMNKGLETIEAHILFNVPISDIQIIIHPQSIVHSAVEFQDGSIIAQLSHPDMCLPIQYAMTYPDRVPCPIRQLDFIRMARLDFARPDFRRFPCLELALSAGRAGGTMPTVLSAANEVAVGAFMKERIRFTDIAKVVEFAVGRHQKIKHPDLEKVLAADRQGRALAWEKIEKLESQG